MTMQEETKAGKKVTHSAISNIEDLCSKEKFLRHLQGH